MNDGSRLGYQLGSHWIRQHPFAFLKLGVAKQVIFLGDDNTGVYWSFAEATTSGDLFTRLPIWLRICGG
jgi:hypothetical protein